MLTGAIEKERRNKRIIDNIDKESEEFQKAFKEICYFFFLCPIDLSKAELPEPKEKKQIKSKQ